MGEGGRLCLAPKPRPVNDKMPQGCKQKRQSMEAFVFDGMNMQIDLLRQEGVEVSDDGYVDLKKYQW